MTELKRCTKGDHCLHPETDHGWLPATLEYFYADKRHGNHLKSQCKKCHADVAEKTRDKVLRDEYQKKYQKEHPEKDRARKERFKERHPGKTNEYSRDWYHRNAEEQRERTAKYKEGHREQVLERSRTQRRNNPEPSRMHTRRRVAREKGLTADFTLQEWQYALDYFSHCCAVCGRPEGNGYHIAADHWIPLASDQCTGTTRLNIIPLCHSITQGVYHACNNSKRSSLPDAWLKKRFGEERAVIILQRVESYFKHLSLLDKGQV